MKRFSKSMLGVTLLEIMLVLAIAAMIIVMSIRYYQSATASAQANQTMQEIQGIIAAMDNLGIGGGYSGISTTSVAAIVGSSNMLTPSGSISVSNATTYSYTVTVPLTSQVCTSVAAQLSNNAKITVGSCGTSGSGLSFTYNRTN